MNRYTVLRSRTVPSRAETCIEFTARLWLRTALVAWAGWLGLWVVLLVRT